jgi:hypothetical protein
LNFSDEPERNDVAAETRIFDGFKKILDFFRIHRREEARSIMKKAQCELIDFLQEKSV